MQAGHNPFEEKSNFANQNTDIVHFDWFFYSASAWRIIARAATHQPPRPDESEP